MCFPLLDLIHVCFVFSEKVLPDSTHYIAGTWNCSVCKSSEPIILLILIRTQGLAFLQLSLSGFSQSMVYMKQNDRLNQKKTTIQSKAYHCIFCIEFDFVLPSSNLYLTHIFMAFYSGYHFIILLILIYFVIFYLFLVILIKNQLHQIS